MREILRDALKDLGYFEEKNKRERRWMIESAEKRYTELNHGELITATGAFALLINFLIGKDSFSNVLFLQIGIILLFLGICLKSFIYRRSAGIIEEEIWLFDDEHNQMFNKRLISIKTILKEDLSSEEEAFLSNYEEKLKDVIEKKKAISNRRKTGMWLNFFEGFLLYGGLFYILLFFIFNT